VKATSTYKIHSASTLSGYRVRNEKNEDLGTIEELMIDAASGRVAYAVLCFGGFLGHCDKLFAIPWSLFTLRTEDRVFTLNIDRETLAQAPGFDANEWPDFSDESWSREIHSYYGHPPYWALAS
jgi:sporulation protein YlmC with PRC-barrel domain